MCRKGAPCRRVLAVTAASARTWSCRPPGSTMSPKSRRTSSVLFSRPRPRCHQCCRDVSRTSFGVPNHLRRQTEFAIACQGVNLTGGSWYGRFSSQCCHTTLAASAKTSTASATASSAELWNVCQARQLRQLSASTDAGVWQAPRALPVKGSASHPRALPRAVDAQRKHTQPCYERCQAV